MQWALATISQIGIFTIWQKSDWCCFYNKLALNCLVVTNPSTTLVVYCLKVWNPLWYRNPHVVTPRLYNQGFLFFNSRMRLMADQFKGPKNEMDWVWQENIHIPMVFSKEQVKFSLLKKIWHDIISRTVYPIYLRTFRNMT